MVLCFGPASLALTHVFALSTGDDQTLTARITQSPAVARPEILK